MVPLNKTPYIDWVVTAYFYAALHLVDAVLADKHSKHPPSHSIRDGEIEGSPFLAGIKDEYQDLRSFSENARYDLKIFTSTQVEQKVVPLYAKIEKHVLGVLQKPTL
jgi:hypothetical protein